MSNDQMAGLKQAVLAYTRKHPESFAGRWIEHDREGPTLVVAFTSDVQRHRDSLPGEVRLVERQHSLAELESAVAAIESAESEFNFETEECSIDVERNQIELVAHSDDYEQLRAHLGERWPLLVYVTPADAESSSRG